MQVLDYEQTSLNIKRLAQASGKSPKTIYTEIGISPQTWYRWISSSEKRLPSLDNLVLVRQTLGTTYEEIIASKEVN